MSPCPCIVSRLAFAGTDHDTARLRSFRRPGSLGPRGEQRCRLRAHRPVGVLLNQRLLLLDDLLQLLFAQLAQEFFVEHGHDSVFLFLCYQLLKQDGLVVLRRVRNRVELLFRPTSLLFRRLLPERSELLRRCRLDLLSVPLCAAGAVRLRRDKLLVTLSRLSRFRRLRALLRDSRLLSSLLPR